MSKHCELNRFYKAGVGNQFLKHREVEFYPADLALVHVDVPQNAEFKQTKALNIVKTYTSTSY